MVGTTQGVRVRGLGRSVLRAVTLAPLVLAFAGGAAPQSANPPQAQAQQAAPPFQITVERNLVVVGVVVRDAKGQPVGDLHKEDFQLLDDGKPQEITGFSVEVSKPQPVAPQARPAAAAPVSATAVAPPPPPALPPQRFIALFFDDLHASVDDYRRTRDAAGRYLTTVRPPDHVALLTASGKNQVDFTSDQKKLHDALFRLAPRVRRSTGCPEISEFEAYLIEREHSADALAIVHREALECSCGLGTSETAQEGENPTDGRPIMMQPRVSGKHGNCQAGAERDAELKATAVWSYAEIQARYSLGALENSVNRLAAMPGQRSLVLVSAGFLTETQADKVDAIINRALQKEVVVSAIYSPGLEAPVPDETAGQIYPLPARLEATKNNLKNIGSAYSTRALASLSSGTGGVFFYNNNDFDEGFRRAAAVPEVLYVLTFSPPELSLNGKFHTLKVTLNTHEHYTVQARRGYFASKTSLVAEAEFTRVISPAAVVTPTKPGIVPPPDNITEPPVPTRVVTVSPPQTFVDLPPEELAKQVHELKHLSPADSQAMLPMILQRVGATVEDFLDGFPNTACSERISSEVENRAVDLAVNTTVYGTTLARAPLQHGAKFNYIALAKAGNKEAPLTEYRTDAKGGPAQLRGAIITSGFVSLIAHFRPAFQKESRFRYLGRVLVKNQNTYVVAFAQRPEVARQAEQVRFQDKTGFVLLQGVAWIDPVSFAILRLRTEILQPDLDVGLQRETTEVEYFPVTFKRDRKTLWLPREVTVSGQLERFAFSNQHRYSQYRLFIVEAAENRKTP
jgi:VWFA-related protein